MTLPPPNAQSSYFHPKQFSKEAARNGSKTLNNVWISLKALGYTDRIILSLDYINEEKQTNLISKDEYYFQNALRPVKFIKVKGLTDV